MKTPIQPFKAQCRKRPSKHLRDRIMEAQDHKCLGCDEPLAAVEYDHVVPLGLGGSNAPKNWAGLCNVCHKTKTRQDLRRIAKAKRQRRYHETGRSRAPSNWTPPGLPKRVKSDWRKHIDGSLSLRCGCEACANKSASDEVRS